MNNEPKEPEESADEDANGGPIEEVDMDSDEILEAWLPARG